MASSAGTITVISHDDVVERELSVISAALGRDLAAYRNHVYRVLTYAMHIVDDEQWREAIAFALAYHDAGLWIAHDIAYLDPSEAFAEEQRSLRASHLDGGLIRAIIHWHHKITPYAGSYAHVVNATRQADWADVTGGLIRRGITRQQVEMVEKAIPVLEFRTVLRRIIADLSNGNRIVGTWRLLTNVFKT